MWYKRILYTSYIKSSEIDTVPFETYLKQAWKTTNEKGVALITSIVQHRKLPVSHVSGKARLKRPHARPAGTWPARAVLQHALALCKQGNGWKGDGSSVNHSNKLNCRNFL